MILLYIPGRDFSWGWNEHFFCQQTKRYPRIKALSLTMLKPSNVFFGLDTKWSAFQKEGRERHPCPGVLAAQELGSDHPALTSSWGAGRRREATPTGT